MTVTSAGGANRACNSSVVARIRLRSPRSAAASTHGCQMRVMRAVSSPPMARVAATASSASDSRLRARLSKASPASVSSTRWVERRNSSQPINRSRLRICRLNAGCDTNRRWAARLKFNSSATATNERRCRSSIVSGAGGARAGRP